jgi:hypothetical protein
MGRRATRAAARAAAEAAAVDPLARVERIIADYQLARSNIGDLTPWDLPIVVACRELIADTLAQLPLVNYRGNLPTPAQPSVVVQPDPFEPRWLTIHRLVNNLTMAGYCWLIPTAWLADGTAAAVRVVDAAEAAGTFDASGRLESVHWQGRRLRPGSEAIWVPFRVDRVAELGTSPVSACWQACEYLAALWQMAGSFWEAGFPSLALVIDGALTSAQRTETKKAMIDATARRHEPVVIDRGGTLAPIGSSAVESQLVESISAANAEVARAFGVMPSLVNVASSDSLTYSTTEGELSKWLKLGLGSYTMRIEAAFSSLRPYGQTVRCSSSELLRTDLGARYNAYSIGVNRWLTVDEVRAAESLPALPDGTFPDDVPTPAVDPSIYIDPLTDPSGVLP